MAQPSQVLSLFCGAGGLDSGFIYEGFNVLLAIDHLEAAINTHKSNFQNSKAECHDLLSIGLKGIISLCVKYFDRNKPLGIIGGPPCQGFSQANHKSTPDDPRNRLASLYIELIEELKKIFVIEFIVFENVMGIKNRKHRVFYEGIINKLNRMGFTVIENELNALDFGVAQVRKRIIIIALNKDYYRGIPIFKKIDKARVVRDVIDSFPEPIFFKRGITQDSIPFHPNHWTMSPKSPKFQDPNLIKEKSRSFRTVDWSKPCPTIAFGNREIYVHPNKKRRLSIYEAMRLQGFEKEFVIKGTLSEQVTQVSNAVPPPMARAIAAALNEIKLRD